MLTFITNGLSRYGVRGIGDMGLADSHGYLGLSFWYLAGAAVVCLLSRRRAPLAGHVVDAGFIGRVGVVDVVVVHDRGGQLAVGFELPL